MSIERHACRFSFSFFKLPIRLSPHGVVERVADGAHAGNDALGGKPAREREARVLAALAAVVDRPERRPSSLDPGVSRLAVGPAEVGDHLLDALRQLAGGVHRWLCPPDVDGWCHQHEQLREAES